MAISILIVIIFNDQKVEQSAQIASRVVQKNFTFFTRSYVNFIRCVLHKRKCWFDFMNIFGSKIQKSNEKKEIDHCAFLFVGLPYCYFRFTYRHTCNFGIQDRKSKAVENLLVSLQRCHCPRAE